MQQGRERERKICVLEGLCVISEQVAIKGCC